MTKIFRRLRRRIKYIVYLILGLNILYFGILKGKMMIFLIKITLHCIYCKKNRACGALTSGAYLGSEIIDFIPLFNTKNLLKLDFSTFGFSLSELNIYIYLILIWAENYIYIYLILRL